jgi:SAM-dependent methyltransferase
MLLIKPIRSRQQWAEIFSHAKHGHILWDGWAPDPYAPDHAYVSAYRDVETAVAWGMFKPRNKVLDLGCGNGRLEIALADMDLEVVGIDPMAPCIDFCKWAFDGYWNCEFLFADIWNEVFNPTGAVKAEEYTIPYPDAYFDDVQAYSVFTHLQTVEAASRYMNEIWRVMKPGGKFFSSWYRSPPNPETNDVGRTAYKESDILTMLQGFSFEYTYGGHSDKFYDQWALYGTKL